MIGPVLTLLLLLFGVGVVVLALWARRLAKGAERLVPRAGQIVTVPGGAIHVVETGSPEAPPVVLVHGLSGQLQHYTYAMTEALSASYRVIALDRPGCGYSIRETDDAAALNVQAQMIWAALDHLNVQRPILVGHSLGGAVVLAMAVERPGVPAGLALITPWTHPQAAPSSFLDGLRVQNPVMRRLLAHTIAVPLAQRNARATLDHVFAPEPWPADFVTRGGGALGLRPKGYVAASGDLVAAEAGIGPLSERYGTLDGPRGVLLAAQDALLPPAEQGGPLEALGFSVETLEGRGHMLPITAPEACIALIDRIAREASEQKP